MSEKRPLESGAVLPPLYALDPDGTSVDITESVAGHWAVVQFYRGHW